MRYKQLLLVVFIMLACFSSVIGQQYYQYKQLDENWYYFDENQRHQSYEFSKSEKKIFLTLDNSLPDSSTLKMFVGTNTSIFINQQIVDFIDVNTVISYSIDSLFSMNGPDVDQLTIMLYHANRVIVKNGEILKPVVLLKNAIPASDIRMDTSHESVFIVLILIILITFTYIKIAHADIWRAYMKWARMISLKDQGDSIYKIRPFEKGTLIIVLAYAALGATAILGLMYLSSFSLPFSTYFENSRMPLVLFKWLGLVILLFALTFGRYFLVQSFTKLFGFREATRIHFYNHVRTSMVIFIVLLIGELIVIFGFHRVALFSWLINVLVIMLLLKSLLISFKLMKISTYRIFHLFSYLCATELIPAIILVRITFLT